MSIIPSAALMLVEVWPCRQVVGRYVRKLLERALERALDSTVHAAQESDLPRSDAYTFTGAHDESIGNLTFLAAPCLLVLLLMILNHLKSILAKLSEPVVILIRDSFSGSFRRARQTTNLTTQQLLPPDRGQLSL